MTPEQEYQPITIWSTQGSHILILDIFTSLLSNYYVAHLDQGMQRSG